MLSVHFLSCTVLCHSIASNNTPPTHMHTINTLQLEKLVKPGNKAVLDATPGLVVRFVRGYVLRSFQSHSGES